MPEPYCTLFVGTLEQESALSVGGNQPHARFDDVLCRDGKDRPTLRGQGLAGALLRTARTLFQEQDLQDITGSQAGGAERNASLWSVENAHPLGSQEHIEGRHGVGIRQDTGAAAEGVSYDIETLGRGTRWPFCLAVDTHALGGEKAARIAAAVLQEWARGRCWLGRSPARGMGWMRLKDLTAVVLTTDHLALWPAALGNPQVNPPPRTLTDFTKQFTNKGVQVVPLTNFATQFTLPSFTAEWYYLEVEGCLFAGPAANGYGWDAISVGGQEAAALPWSHHLIKPRGQRDTPATAQFKPDHAIPLTPTGDPYLPGSGLRGPLRHALSRRLNAQAGGNKVIRDPNARGLNAGGGNGTDIVEAIFGQPTCGAALLIQDVHLATAGDWLATVLHAHAEDEFSAGAYPEALFNRVALLKGGFRWRLVLEGPDQPWLQDQWALLRPILAQAEQGHLGIGGGRWRGLGSTAWGITSRRLCQAGSDAPLPVTLA